MFTFVVVGISVALLVVALIIEARRHQQSKASRALLVLTNENRRLLQVSRTDNYFDAVKILRQLGLADNTGIVKLNNNIWNFDLVYLFKALGEFWRLRWLKLPPAKRQEEISRAAHDFILEFHDDFDRLEDLLAVIKRHQPDVAEFIEVEISNQLQLD